MDKFDRLLTCSHDFSAFLTETVAAKIPFGDEHPEAVAAAELCFEHAFALRALFEVGAANSATAMLRLQYEALLRSAWLLYAASNGQLSKVSAPLSRERAEAAKNLPGADEMLKALERRLLTTPELKGLVQPLREIRDASWSAMNAFVHTGLHPLARAKEGFPLELAMSIVKMSNGMLHMAARLLARLTPSVELVSKVERSYVKFEDCLPVVTPPPEVTPT